MPQKLTTEDIHHRLKDKNIYLVGEYLGTHKKTVFRCESGHEWSARVAHVLNGSGCPSCKRWTIETINELLLPRGIKLISGFTNSNSKATFSCSKNHTWQSSPITIIHRNYGCPHCAGNFKLSDEVINERLLLRGIKIISRTIDKNNRHAEFICKQGHTWVTGLNHVLGGTGCPSCTKHGFNPNLPANFYVLLFDTYIKYGITNKLEQRMYQHKLNNGNFVLCFNLPLENGQTISRIEKNIKNIVGTSYVNKEICRDGWTETANIESIQKILPILILAHGLLMNDVSLEIDKVLETAERMYQFVNSGVFKK